MSEPRLLHGSIVACGGEECSECRQQSDSLADLAPQLADALEQVTAENALMREQNAALEVSATYCASCGYLAPNHADGCGRWELMLEQVTQERDRLTAQFEHIKALPTQWREFNWPTENQCADELDAILKGVE